MEPKKSGFNTALKYAIITSLAALIFSIIMYMTGLYLNQGISWLSFVILLAGLIFAVRDRRDKELGGFITYGQAFSQGFLFTLLLSVFGVITGYIMLNFIAPDMIEETLKMSEQKLIEKGLTDDQVKMGMDMTRRFMTPVWMMIWIFVGNIIMGLILSLIVAAIFKKEDQHLQQPQ